jgi:hypothetical protein
MIVKKILTLLLFILFILFILLLGLPKTITYALQEESNLVWPLNLSDFKISISQGKMLNSTSSNSLGTNMHISGGSSSGSPISQQKISIRLKAKNLSVEKLIKEIHWEVTFLNTQKQAVKNSFKSKKKINPTKEEIIEETFFLSSSISTKLNLGFRVNKIQYEDNSFWEGNYSNAISDFVFQAVEVN